MNNSNNEHHDKRLIEQGFPCHQVGAEPQRERGASNVMPPIYYLHVWWARRPLTPSRAAIVASLDPAGTDPEKFVRQLGIERLQVEINGEPWTLTGDIVKRVTTKDGTEVLEVDEFVLKRLAGEEADRGRNRRLIREMQQKDSRLEKDPVLLRWERESTPLPRPWPTIGELLPVQRVMGDPACFKQLMALARSTDVRVPNLYG